MSWMHALSLYQNLWKKEIDILFSGRFPLRGLSMKHPGGKRKHLKPLRFRCFPRKGPAYPRRPLSGSGGLPQARNQKLGAAMKQSA